MILPIRLSAELRDAIAPLWRVMLPIVLISSVYNILLLSGSFFMLLVYDDVLPSQSIPSLVSLLVLVMLAYTFQAVLDVIRSRIMVHIGSFFMKSISSRSLAVISEYELVRGPLPHGIQIVRDVETVRAYLAGTGPLAILDLPWICIYLSVLSIFHWSIGLLSLSGVLMLILLLIINNRMTSPIAQIAMRTAANRSNLAEATRRNAETLKALGMTTARQREWGVVESEHLQANERFSYIASTLGGLTKAFRMFLQSATLALGAFLVIEGEATGGVIIAGSILSARALAPVEQAIANWKGMMGARLSLIRLGDVFQALPIRIEPMGLDMPSRSLEAKGLTLTPPGIQRLILADVSFKLVAGDALAVVGRSGSGKTSLSRAICGVWPILRGSVRFDGATLNQWGPDEISRIVGYVPQNIELFEGTIAQNISRFQENLNQDAILRAAKAADCHELIVRLENGYDHLIGANGSGLSAGQQQRIALARALYNEPFLVVLDEPNSNLDYEGELALGLAIRHIRERRGIVIVVAHRANAINNVSHVMTINNGRLERFETRSEFEKRASLSVSLKDDRRRSLAPGKNLIGTPPVSKENISNRLDEKDATAEIEK